MYKIQSQRMQSSVAWSQICLPGQGPWQKSRKRRNMFTIGAIGSNPGSLLQDALW